MYRSQHFFYFWLFFFLQKLEKLHENIYLVCMQMTKNDIKSWLRAHKKTRAWLASQLGVSLGSINNYLSTKQPIPERSMRLIVSILTDSTNPPQSLSVTIPEEFTAYVSAESKRRGISEEDFCTNLISAVLKATLPTDRLGL